jgi:hypothetical protein
MKYLFIFIIILTLCITKFFYYKRITEQYDNSIPPSILDDKQLSDIKGYNSYPQLSDDLPVKNNRWEAGPEYFTYVMRRNEFYKLIDLIPNKLSDNYGDEQLIFNDDTHNYNLPELNKNTWKNRINEYNPDKKLYFNTIESNITDINMILSFIVSKMNTLYNEVEFNKLRISKFDTEPYFIYKYKITKIEKSNNIIKYTIIIIVFKYLSLYANTIEINGYVSSQLLVTILSTNILGQYATDQLLLAPGLVNSNFKQNNLNNENDLIDENTVDSLLKHKLQSFETKLEDQYACFNVTQDSNKYLLNVPDKKMCETKYDVYGQSKDYGVWDKPCKTDKECKFNNLNQNYSNSFGKCLQNGRCDTPLGTSLLGYHHIKGKPLCYNCDSSKWLPLTILDTCCKEQFDKIKYPNLNGPDYAYHNDKILRLNQVKK